MAIIGIDLGTSNSAAALLRGGVRGLLRSHSGGCAHERGGRDCRDCDAVLGADVGVPTLTKEATVKIPPGTQPGSVLRLRGKSLPHFGGTGRGDLFLRVDMRVPDHLTSEERKLYERLRALGKKDGQ
jgi:DnaJ C terminal domain